MLTPIYACDTCVRMRGTIIRIMRMRTANCLMLSSHVIVSGFRAALDLDTYPLSNFIRPWCAERAKRGRGKPVLLAFSLVFKPYLSNAVASAKSPHYFSCPCSTEDVGIAHKPPRSL